MLSRNAFAISVISISVAFPAQAVTMAKLEVAGIKIGDPIGSVKPKLTAKGFVKVNAFLNRCDTTYQKLMAAKSAKKETRVSGGEIDCYEGWTKPGAGVDVYYLLTPNGYVVDSVSYRFSSTERRDQILGQLVTKFGNSSSENYGITTWLVFADNKYGPQASYSKSKSDDQHSVSIAGKMEKVFLEEINKSLAKKLGRMSNDL